MRTLRAWAVFFGVFAAAVPSIAQSVISAHSGLIYYFDGFVYLDGQQLQPHLGKFPSVPQGTELRTGLGRAEVVLTPGVFLRVGDKSAIRMLSNDLADTRVELLEGSAILDSAEPNSGTAVTVVFKDWQVRSPQAGVYRIDADPPHVWVVKGKAEVTAGPKGQPISVDQGMDLALEASPAPEQSSAEPADGLSDWNKGRGDSIMADNAITQQIDGDPASQTASLNGLNGFSNFPFLGITPMFGLTYNSYNYNSVLPVQPGFYSVYLPGYAYPPALLQVLLRGAATRATGFPTRVGVPVGIGRVPSILPGGVVPIVGPRPVAPLAPTGVAAPRAAAHPAGHAVGVGHR